MTVNAVERREQLRRMWSGIMRIWADATDAASYLAVMALALAIASAIYGTYWPSLFTWAFFTTFSIYMILFVIAYRRRDRYTLDEIGERLDELDHDINEKLDEVIRNV